MICFERKQPDAVELAREDPLRRSGSDCWKTCFFADVNECAGKSGVPRKRTGQAVDVSEAYETPEQKHRGHEPGLRFQGREAERAGGNRLLRIVSGEQQLDATPLANEYGACQVNGVERLDDRRHRFRRFVDNGPAQSNAPDGSFDLDQFLSSPGDLSVVVESLESKPIDRPATFDAQKLTGIGCRPFAPAAQPARLRKQRPEHHARIEVHNHRSCRSSPSSVSRSIVFRGRTPLMRLNAAGGLDSAIR